MGVQVTGPPPHGSPGPAGAELPQSQFCLLCPQEARVTGPWTACPIWACGIQMPPPQVGAEQASGPVGDGSVRLGQPSGTEQSC